jgi:hypothetical protein
MCELLPSAAGLSLVKCNMGSNDNRATDIPVLEPAKNDILVSGPIISQR